MRRIPPTITRYFHNRILLVGIIMLVSLVLLAAIGLMLIPYNPLQVGLFTRNMPPSSAHPLGTDSFGRDVSGQLLLGILNSLEIAAIAIAIGTCIGSVVGLLAGFHAGKIDTALGIITDTFIVIPMIVVMVVLFSLMRVVEVWMSGLAFSLFAWATPAKTIRSQVLSLRKREFVDIARLSGLGESEIIFIEIFPHMLPWIVASAITNTVWILTTEASLSFLGLGPFHTATIGTIEYWAINYGALLQGFWWWWLTPILTLIYIFLSLFIINIGLNRIFNPRLKEG